MSDVFDSDVSFDDSDVIFLRPPSTRTAALQARETIREISQSLNNININPTDNLIGTMITIPPVESALVDGACPICHEEFLDGSTILIFACPGKHIICEACGDKYNDDKCVICRSPCTVYFRAEARTTV
jgi:zinc-RING finger domain